MAYMTIREEDFQPRIPLAGLREEIIHRLVGQGVRSVISEKGLYINDGEIIYILSGSSAEIGLRVPGKDAVYLSKWNNYKIMGLLAEQYPTIYSRIELVRTASK